MSIDAENEFFQGGKNLVIVRRSQRHDLRMIEKDDASIEISSDFSSANQER